jgi:DNA-binding transcriptional ArsR family regulator
MSVVFEKSPTLKELLITNTEKAKALEDPLRIAIIDMLSHKAMSVEEITNELKKKKFNKAPTSVRHHIDILKDAGLIELVKMKEVKGGGVLKYYASSAKLFSYNAPKEFVTKFKPAIDETSNEIMQLLSKLTKKHTKELKEMAESLKACPYCNTQHFVEFLLLEILRSATVEAVKRKEFAELIKSVK